MFSIVSGGALLRTHVRPGFHRVANRIPIALVGDDPRTYAADGRVLDGRFPAPWRQDSRPNRWL